MSQRLHCEIDQGVATITLDDGKVNVMSTAMLQDIDSALDTAEEAGAIVVLRSGRPGIFSAGFDLKIISSGDPQRTFDMVRAGAELALRLMMYPHPTIGVLQGHAFPMGTFLLLGCDVRLAGEGNHRMGLNEVAIGIAPPSFAVELARNRMHPAWHSRTVTLGEMFEPEDAVKAGLLDRVVPAEKVEQAVDAVLTAVKAIHRPSHTLAKQRLRAKTAETIRAAMDAEITLAAYKARAV